MPLSTNTTGDASPLDAAAPAERGLAGDAAAFGTAAAKGAGSAVVGMVKGIGNLAIGAYNIVTDQAARERAWETTKNIATATKDYAGEAIDDPTKVYRDARDGATGIYQSFDEKRKTAAAAGQSSEFWGDLTGHGIVEVGSFLIPVGAATKAGKLAKAASAAEESAVAVTKAAARAEAVFAESATTVAGDTTAVLPCGKVVTKAPKASNLPVPRDQAAFPFWGQRPAPVTYLSKEYIEAHLAHFKEGVVKIVPEAKGGTVGPPSQLEVFSHAGPIRPEPGHYVLPKSVVEEAITKSGGDVRKLEQLLGLEPPGYLGKNPMLVEIHQPQNLRIATGNELGARNQPFVPGGFTRGGIPEAVIDEVPELLPSGQRGYTVRPVFSK